MESEEYAAMAAVENHMWWYRGLHEWMIDRIRAIQTAAKLQVLDCGAGTGGFANNFTRQIPDVNLVAIDIDAQATRYFAGKSAAPIVQGSVNELPFATDSFDLIVSSDVLYHSAVDETKALSEIHRCLKSGGSVMLNLPAYGWMKSAHDDRVHTARRYTAGIASRKLVNAQFQIVEATYRNALLFPIMALFRLTVGRFTTKSDVDDVPGWQNLVFGGVIAFENALARKGLRFPFGGSVYVHAVKK